MGCLENFAFHFLLMVSKSNHTCIHEGNHLQLNIFFSLPFTSAHCFRTGGLARPIKWPAASCSPRHNTAPTDAPTLLSFVLFLLESEKGGKRKEPPVTDNTDTA